MDTPQASNKTHAPIWPAAAWTIAVFAGLVGPVSAMLMLSSGSYPSPVNSGTATILAVGLMGAGMIGTAIAGRFWVGIALAVLSGAILLLVAHLGGRSMDSDALTLGLAVIMAAISFSARGTLFARSGLSKGWWIALGVVGGEAAVVLSAMVDPGIWPDWLLALLPAQWATLAFQAALSGEGIGAAWAALVALGGTAVATLVVVSLWPKKWTYAVMFTTWLAMAALVYHQG